MAQPSTHLAVIADLVKSRSVTDREQVQATLRDTISDINRRNGGIASPYTLTLGDELQALLGDGRRAFDDAVTIQAAVHPVMVRFSLAVGTLTTAVNPAQALGMDGPAFHRARDGIETLKSDNTSLFYVSGLQPDTAALSNASLSLISHDFSKWHGRRFQILADLQRDIPVPDIARRLGVSEQAIYKNISDGRLKDVLATFAAIGTFLNQALGR